MKEHISRVCSKMLVWNVILRAYWDYKAPKMFFESNFPIRILDYKLQDLPYVNEIIFKCAHRIKSLNSDVKEHIPDSVVRMMTRLEEFVVLCRSNERCWRNFATMMKGNKEHLRKLEIYQFDGIAFRYLDGKCCYKKLTTLKVENGIKECYDLNYSKFEWSRLVDLINQCPNITHVNLGSVLIQDAMIDPSIKIKDLRVRLTYNSNSANVVKFLMSCKESLKHVTIVVESDIDIFKAEWFLPKVEKVKVVYWPKATTYTRMGMKHHFNDYFEYIVKHAYQIY